MIHPSLLIAAAGILEVGKLAGRAGSWVLCGTAIWYVAANAMPPNATAVLHVMEADVVVSLDDQHIHVAETSRTPFVFELPPGEHRLRMCRGAEILYNEAFLVQAGDNVVLTAWSYQSSGDEGPESSDPDRLFDPRVL